MPKIKDKTKKAKGVGTSEMKPTGLKTLPPKKGQASGTKTGLATAAGKLAAKGGAKALAVQASEPKASDRPEGMVPIEEFESWVMAGTEGTKEYVVLVRTPHCGRLGVRDLGGADTFRVRVEPVDQGAAEILQERFGSADDWKQPGDDDQFRFSKVVDFEGLQEEVSFALEALGVTAEASASGLLEVNPNLPDWAKQLLAGTFGAVDDGETDEDETEDADDPNAGLDADGRAPEGLAAEGYTCTPDSQHKGGKNEGPMNGC